ncbi:GH15654 [Drosophila grimshawi]|uniref:GH15654 n=1 Tax=Drosophila grimshawi TaxID=7222 RepID=B4JUJ8_DROGR|nr:GH15654 [Drosophila grimshawi]
MYRDKHNCPPLLLDDALTQDSRVYAEELAQKEQLEHSSGDYGENLCMTSGDPLKCVRMWYDEIKDYNFDEGKFSLETGHFTQLIWMSSKWLGIGKAKSKSGAMYVVGRYSPAGNVEGQFIENVPKLKK